MICPYCGKVMKRGCIQCRDGVYWSEKERLIAALGIGGGQTIKLSGNSTGIFGGSVAEAFCCDECNKIIIEYSNS